MDTLIVAAMVCSRVLIYGAVGLLALCLYTNHKARKASDWNARGRSAVWWESMTDRLVTSAFVAELVGATSLLISDVVAAMQVVG